MAELFDEDAELTDLQSYEKSVAWWKEEVRYNKVQFLSSLGLAAIGLGVDTASITYSIVTRNPLWLLPGVPGTIALACGYDAVNEFKDVRSSTSTLALWEDRLARETELA
jgi:hypothetical protein